MADEIYCYAGSDVLKNKLGITSEEKLSIVERKLTMIRTAELIKHPENGQYDFAHLKKIHAYIFQDLYDWAGQVRKVNIAKGNMFCNVTYIGEQAKIIFDQLKKENNLAGLTQEVFVKKLAYYFSEINALHPFREGNGRTQREFIRQLAYHQGYKLYWNLISKEEMEQASKASFICEYQLMEVIFGQALKKIT